MNPIILVIIGIWIVIIIVAIKAFLETREEQRQHKNTQNRDRNANEAVGEVVIAQGKEKDVSPKVVDSSLEEAEKNVPVAKTNHMTEWIGIIAMGFLIAGFIWVFYEAIGGRFGWGASFLFLFGLVVAILVYLGKKSKDE
ncbi:hypothetical protein ACFLUO_04320 [Chloroflexota bacterium]